MIVVPTTTIPLNENEFWQSDRADKVQAFRTWDEYYTFEGCRPQLDEFGEVQLFGYLVYCARILEYPEMEIKPYDPGPADGFDSPEE